MTNPAPGTTYRPPTALFVAITAGGLVAMAMMLPSIPSIGREFAAPAAEVQLTLTLYILTYAVGQLVAGPLSDQYGRKPLVIAGLTLYTIGGAACTFAPTLEILIVGRVIQAAGACSGLVVVRAMIRDVYDTAETARVMSLVAACIAMAPAISPIIGGLLEVHLGWRSVFAATFVYGALILVPSQLFLRETRPGAATSAHGLLAMGRSFALLLGARRFVGYSGIAASASATFMSFMASAPFVLIGVVGLDPDEMGWALTLFPGGFMVGSYAASRITRRIGMERMIWAGIALACLAAAAMLALALANELTVAAILAPPTVIGVAHGLMVPNAMAGAVSVRVDLAGAASALSGALQMGASGLMSAVMGLMVYRSQLPMAAAMLCVCLVGLGSVMLLRPDRRAQPAPEMDTR